VDPSGAASNPKLRICRSLVSTRNCSARCSTEYKTPKRRGATHCKEGRAAAAATVPSAPLDTALGTDDGPDNVAVVAVAAVAAASFGVAPAAFAATAPAAAPAVLPCGMSVSFGAVGTSRSEWTSDVSPGKGGWLAR